ncbi:MAG TPA: tryptophan-rich sensory protein [Firmicutes bacterium]|nr:tryptophan-rich sensory protein [Bacillota bacterium]
MKKRNDIAICALTALSYGGMLIVNYLANALPLGGMSTGRISDLYPNLFVPSGFTFSIWGLIYLMLGLSTVFFVIKTGTHADGLYRKLACFFVASSFLNAGWIFSWHYRLPGLSLVIMILFLLTLNAIMIILWDQDKKMTSSERIFLFIPFSLYFAWLNIAFLANFTALKVHMGWTWGVSDMFWAMTMIFIAVIRTIYRVVRRKDIIFSIVASWALLGIIHKRLATGEAREVSLAALTGLLAIAIALIVAGLEAKRNRVEGPKERKNS